ncbi:BA75_03254T0 [Komagataella pastoris]|uniref:BA75_03254T0 n=1 Tax=Komagataella pastoris TaxID=4922 RepID=A0A1B2JCH6_PICPA|nr:BA75_03254T0 [Komagataella pastoris]
MDSELRFPRLVFTKRKPTGLNSKELLTAKKESKRTKIPTVNKKTRSKAGSTLFKKHEHEDVANPASKVKNNSTFQERLEKQNVYDFAEETQSKPFSHSPSHTVSLGEKYKEWGPSINGYRFLDTEEKVKEYSVPTAEPQDTYGLSYPEDSSEPLANHLQTYEEYIQNWKENTRLYWPNEENSWTCVSYDSIEQFLRGNKSLSAFKKRLKVERIRWHPDKMKRNINCDEKDLILVTETFQLINKLWEDFFKVKHS